MTVDDTDRGRLVAQLLELASREGSLSGERLEAMGRGLASQADSIVRDRVRLAKVTQERDWLRDTVASKEREVEARERERRWLLDTIAQRDEEQRWLEELLEVAERARAREREALQDEHRKASDAHDRLLGHHRGLLARMAAEMRSAADAPRWSGRARRRLSELAELLERELS